MVEIKTGSIWKNTYPVVALRKEPNHRSEMTTQLLFGDTFSVLDVHEEWCNVQIEFDLYQGWLDKKLFYGDFSPFQSNETNVWVNPKPMFQNSFLIPAGCFHEKTPQFLQEITKHFPETENLNIAQVAESYLNSPYLWGGKTHWGIDCSGLVQQVFKICGVSLPRDAYQQAESGINVRFGDHQKYDLAFFGENGKTTHVGILKSESEIIHAHGHVRIDELTEIGIINKKIKQKTHSLMHIKRIL